MGYSERHHFDGKISSGDAMTKGRLVISTKPHPKHYFNTFLSYMSMTI